jgi:hypothetical protein
VYANDDGGTPVQADDRNTPQQGGDKTRQVEDTGTADKQGRAKEGAPASRTPARAGRNKLEWNERNAENSKLTTRGTKPSEPQEADGMQAGAAAEEATGQVPAGDVRRQQLPPEEQRKTDHEPYGADELPVKEKQPARRES